jgi:hypothetical protein
MEGQDGKIEGQDGRMGKNDRLDGYLFRRIIKMYRIKAEIIEDGITHRKKNVRKEQK